MSPKTKFRNLNKNLKIRNFRNFVQVVFILFLIILLTNVILQCSLAAEIKGKVVGINGENLSGAEVKIYEGINLMQKVVTVNGTYTINLGAGNYFVVVTYIDKKENLYIDSINLAIGQNETKSIDFSLIAQYTNFSDADIPPALEDIFKMETNLTGSSQPNGSNGTNLPASGDISSNILLLVIIFAIVIIFVFFYILYVYYKAENIEEKIDVVETIIKKGETGKEAEEKQRAAITTHPIPSAATPLEKEESNKKEGGKAEKKEEDADKKEQYKVMIQKERENLLLSLTENERIVINVLMEHEGDLLRTEIARGTKLPKSSLAMALKKLEDRKIIEIDKTFTIHKVKFTTWFKSFL
ncbi:MAG: hypothetical protein GW779_05805 [Candidatus Altiarchaeum hamiconexum]|uniref:Uncharacterized protein n=1 Tax=Candidatus Altarchaeum hamiconexum TaxID=1803513 RepID=A0A8J7YVI4_9ARCH|nr:hypothetical protein [Candidatus Altarchaeum hamiconexum]OIQ05182.1 MAG: hypothetical protein AUK59_04850 [Candidatus Altarchaeum sp. CG2_30_32_3053]PIN67617.1 MAG: hypothetical protein COV98_02245 [Candidatus Altarchaeum sp. CG12_big_fil_rev_8_21_14_0_65_33_22]PIV27006.1 MAG: hypothetical protein COS36_07320 [Candidatus Altarchaeum sp. CG03_land_8_20_14_0_80_32_618]PIZ31657.1 MAG: hypothetical protein COY41_02230 [Candidatus Altarchaeum sp. CG_4_10_14_0_8_um_filter_32_851]PJC13890.1 MAG: h